MTGVAVCFLSHQVEGKIVEYANRGYRALGIGYAEGKRCVLALRFAWCSHQQSVGGIPASGSEVACCFAQGAVSGAAQCDKGHGEHFPFSGQLGHGST